MKLPSKLKLSIPLAVSFLFPTFQALCQDNFFDPSGYDVYISGYNWTTNYEPAEPLSTTDTYAGTYWDTFAFQRNSINGAPATGFIDFPITGTVTSRNKVDKCYRRAVVHVTFTNTDWRDIYPHSVSMHTSLTSDFGDVKECVSSKMLSAQGEFFIFDIPESENTEFYRFNFEVPAGGPKDAWVNGYEIFLYTSADDLTVTFNKEEQSCTFVAKRGDLHVKMTEYDSSGNVVNSTPLNNGKYNLKEELWQNRVAGQGEPYVVYAPSDINNHLEITAKTIFEGKHSEEKIVKLSQEGITSGTELNSIIEDNSAKIEWFDVNGRKLQAPTSGLMIKKQGSKSSKIFIK